MNKLTSDQQILGHFVRIRTILRRSRKAVKRRCTRKSPLPHKNAGCLTVCHSGMRLLAQTLNPAACTASGFRVRSQDSRPGMTGQGTARLHVCMQTVSSQGPNADRDDEPGQIMIRLTVNGTVHDVDTALLYVLRNDLELNGPKYGCGLGECGSAAC
jgi:hypothetical protein